MACEYYNNCETSQIWKSQCELLSVFSSTASAFGDMNNKFTAVQQRQQLSSKSLWRGNLLGQMPSLTTDTQGLTIQQGKCLAFCLLDARPVR